VSRPPKTLKTQKSLSTNCNKWGI